MRKSSLFRKIITSNWILAVIPAMAVILLLPSLGSRYRLSVMKAPNYAEQMIYSDMNSDGISEIVCTGKGIPYYYIAVKDNDLHYFDQWNLKGNFDPFVSELFTGDFDNDSYKEVYVFTHKGDSLFLNVNEMLQHLGLRMNHIFISKIGFVNNQVTSLLMPIGLFDENGDGKSEFYFSISTALVTEPRKVYFFDLVNRKLQCSSYTASICLSPEMKDVDGDKRPEIFGISSASGNYPSNVPYSDSSTWFMVFNDKLQFEFPPVGFRGFANSLEVKGYNKEDFRGYVLSHISGGTDTSVIKSQISIYTADGKYVRSRLYKSFIATNDFKLCIFSKNNSDRIIVAADNLYELNVNLEIVKSTGLPYRTRYFTYQADIDGNNEDELLLYFQDEDELYIYSSELQFLGKTRIKPASTIWRLSGYKLIDHKPGLFLGAGNTGFFLQIMKNKYFYIINLIYPASYFFFYFFILLIKRITTYQVVQKEFLKQRLVTLQLHGIKAQLDPHFTFNTLNSVASLIYLDDRQAAYDYMNKFTRLLRVMLNDAERLYRSLGEEIDFVTTYLDLEKLRFGEKFDYNIEIGGGVSQKEQVPKLVLQTFAENAVKHGLMPCTEGGVLKIKAEREDDYLKLTIEDNGVGRERAQGISTSTGKGLKLTGEFYDILNQIYKYPVKHTITDLYTDEGKPFGTRVIVLVPLDNSMR